MKGRIRMSEHFAWVVFAFLTGGLAGSILTGHFLAKTYRQSIKEARDERDAVAKDLDNLLDARSQELKKKEAELDDSLSTIGKVTKLDYSSISPRRKNPDLRVLACKYGDPDAENEFLPEKSVEEFLAETDGPRDDRPIRDPFEITAQEFEMDYGSIEVASLSYYQEDGVLTDERDVVILEPVEIIGEEGLQDLADTTEATLYFHNDAQDKNFEVDVLHEQSYRRDVLGIDDSQDGLAKDDDIDE